jgi:putative effector of murein hydrolase LrgA (UPF0299 family)
MSKWNRPTDILEALAIIVGCLFLGTIIVLAIGLVEAAYL